MVETDHLGIDPDDELAQQMGGSSDNTSFMSYMTSFTARLRADAGRGGKKESRYTFKQNKKHQTNTYTEKTRIH